MTEEEKKEKKETYLELAKLSQSDFASRRTLEWKLSLGLWGSIAAFVYMVVKTEKLRPKVADSLSEMSWWPFLLIGIVHVSIILVVQISHARDKKLYWWYREQMEGSSEPRPWKINPTSAKLGVCGWIKQVWNYWNPCAWFLRCLKDRKRCCWFVYHIAVTIFVLCGAWFLLTLDKSCK